jgi:hypothetical protein
MEVRTVHPGFGFGLVWQAGAVPLVTTRGKRLESELMMMTTMTMMAAVL